MKARDLKLDKYSISKLTYRELKYFCLQYPEKRRKLADLRGLGAQQYSGMPHSPGVSDPVGEKGAKAAALSRDTDMIEAAAQEASPSDWRGLLKNVTEEGRGYWYLRCHDLVSCGETTFYRRRRLFFHLLAQRKELI